jgi:extradiol dioxygenase family protein
MASIFHLALNITDLAAARRFYGTLLGCEEGRSTETWVDFDFFGHQLSLHLGQPFSTAQTGVVDGAQVPMPHFGVVLLMPQWSELAQHLTDSGLAFEFGPSVRFPGQAGEQATMFFRDPSGNPLEIKGIASHHGVFAQ